jgi:hypothetical protein
VAPPVVVPLLFLDLILENASARSIRMAPAIAISVLVDNAGAGWSGVPVPVPVV